MKALLRTALLLAPLAALHAADDPLPATKAVWRMTSDEAARKQPFALRENGPVKFEQLSSADAAESRKRGGVDTAATLTAESFLSLETEKATQLRPTGDALTLYARARFEPGAAGTLFFSDFLTLGIIPRVSPSRCSACRRRRARFTAKCPSPWWSVAAGSIWCCAWAMGGSSSFATAN